MDESTKNMRWVSVNLEAVKKLTEATTSPGQIYPLDPKNAPENFIKMGNAQSYYVSAYSTPVAMKGVTIGGKFLMQRTEGDITKNYPHYFATSSDNKVYYAAADFHFPAHHVYSSQPRSIEEMFGMEPLAERTKP